MEAISLELLQSRMSRDSMMGTPGNCPETRKLPERIASLSQKDLVTALECSYQLEVVKRKIPFTDISNSEIAEKIDKVSSWFCREDAVRGLFLFGTLGSGKTTLLKAIYGLLRASGLGSESLVMTTSTKLFEEYRANENHLVNQYGCYLRARYLLLDDLGMEPLRCLVYGVERFPIQDLIYERYDRQRITMITSNLDKTELRERYGERMYDRLVEMMLPLCFRAISYRRYNMEKERISG